MMLQFAFGPHSPGARPASGPSVHAGDACALEVSPQMLALAAAARAWWESRRPEGWSLEQHLAEPTAGHSGTAQERLLAEAVARWARQDC